MKIGLSGQISRLHKLLNTNTDNFFMKRKALRATSQKKNKSLFLQLQKSSEGEVQTIKKY